MARSTVFVSNRSQAVRLPKAVAFPEGVHQVEVICLGNSRLITPVGRRWDEFFVNEPRVSDDLMNERDQPSAGKAQAALMLEYIQTETRAPEPEPSDRRTVHGQARGVAVFGESRNAFQAVTGPPSHTVRNARHAHRGPCARQRRDALHQQFASFQRMPGLRVDNWVKISTVSGSSSATRHRPYGLSACGRLRRHTTSLSISCARLRPLERAAVKC